MLLGFNVPGLNPGITKIPFDPIVADWSDSFLTFDGYDARLETSLPYFTYSDTYDKIYAVGYYQITGTPSSYVGEIMIINPSTGNLNKAWYWSPPQFTSSNELRIITAVATGTGTNYYMVGRSFELVSGQSRGFLASLNGSIESPIFTYSQYYAAGALTSSTELYDVTLDSSNNIYSLGTYILSTTPTTTRPIITKHVGSTPTWQRSLSINGFPGAIEVGDSDNIYFATTDTATNNRYIIKMDPSGSIIWSTYISSASGFSRPTSIKYYNGYIFAIGEYTTGTFISIFDTSGNLISQYTITNASNNPFLRDAAIIDGNLYLAGYYDATPDVGMMVCLPTNTGMPTNSFTINGITFSIAINTTAWTTGSVSNTTPTITWGAMTQTSLANSTVSVDNTAYIDNNIKVSF
jgi:hypothetical protein